MCFYNCVFIKEKTCNCPNQNNNKDLEIQVQVFGYKLITWVLPKA